MRPAGGADSGSRAPDVFEPPFCREAELREIMSVIMSEGCRAVFLTSDSGLGASSLLRELAAEARTQVPVVAIHGSKSLSKVPYGVLAPFMTADKSEHMSIGIGVLHSLLADIERRRDELDEPARATSGPALITIDDAQCLDTATADVLVKLVLSGTVNIVLSHSNRTSLPEPLPKLWSMGMAEHITLKPLTQEQGHDFCEVMLGGQVRRGASWQLWSAAAGNPLMLRLTVEAAAGNGQLTQQNGWWVPGPTLPTHGKVLREVIRTQLRDLSDGGRAALNLVALSEPLDESVAREVFGAAAVEELQAWNLVRHHEQGAASLSLTSPLYGDVIREMVPIGQSRLLHEQLIHRLGEEMPEKEALLRRVLWALEVGADVSDEHILKAAIFAAKNFQSATALELLSAIRGSDYRVRAGMVQARAKYNLGQYRSALNAMDAVSGEAENLVDLLFGSLLRATVRSALGMPVEALAADAQALRQGGERLALNHPDQADYILEHSRKNAQLLALTVLSREGRYVEMGPVALVLARTSMLPTAYDKLYRTMAMAMDVERLTAQGFPLQALVRAHEAFGIVHSEDDDVFLLPETVMLRHLAAALCAGEWDVAAAALERFVVEAGPVVYSFSGSSDVVRGTVLVRCGKYADALQVLLPGIDALKMSDPQQLLGYCTAMASYAAAHVGRKELAQRLVREHVESSGMFVVVALERAYLSACRHLVKPDAGGLAELLAQADKAHADDSSFLELNALVLALELGEDSVAARVAELAGAVEGPWARGVGAYGAAVASADSSKLVTAGQQLTEAGLQGLAQQAWARSATAHPGGYTTARPVAYTAPGDSNAHQNERQLSSVLGAEVSARRPGTGDPAPKLTRREHEVAVLAASGLGARETAEKLSLSLRTVEGHLYRAYGKLGISARTELSAALARVSRGK